jgi:predicted nucleic acid-binding protein
MNAIDTNVLVYAVDGSEPAKQSQAVGLLETLSGEATRLVIPWQVAVEFVACLRRWEVAGRITRDDTLAYKAHLLDSPPIVMPSAAKLDLSLDLSGRYSLSYWDSLLLAACVEAGITTLYSEDLDSGMTYDSVTVINPFE